MTEANPSGATNVDGAFARISTLMNPEPEQPTEAKAGEVQEAPEKTKHVEAVADTPEGDTQPPAEMYKVKVGDEEKEVTIEDLQKGYMMESDYRKKTSAVSESKRALEAKAAEIDSQLEQAKLLLDVDLSKLNTPEMQDLKETDPEEYLRQVDAVQARHKTFEDLKAKREEEHKAKRGDIVAKETELLNTAIPEWLDADVKTKEANQTFSTLQTLGFTDQELGDMTDHRMFVLARKAMLFDQMMSQDLSKKEVKAAPKSQQPSTSTAGSDRADSKEKNLRGTLRKTGNMRDAAKLFKNMMEK